MFAVEITAVRVAAAAFVIGAVALGLGVLAWRRRDQAGAVPLATVLVLDAIWLFTDGLRLLSGDLAATLTVYGFQQAVVIFVPVVWLLFVLEYTGHGDWVRTRVVAGLMTVPLLASALSVTNGVHGLYWTDPALTTSGDLSVLTVTFRPAYWLAAAYAFLLISVGLGLLVRLLAKTRSMYRRQALLVLLAAVFPATTSALFLTGNSPVPELDLTPYSVLVEGAILFYALHRYRLLDLSPVARATVIERMGDGMLVVDDSWMVVDANPAARDLAVVTDPVERGLREGFPSLAELTDDPSAVETLALRDPESGSATGATTPRGEQAYFDVEVTTIEDNAGELAGRLLTLSDVTERERRERTLEAIQTASRDLMSADTVEAVCERTVTAMQDVLGLRFTCVHLLRDGTLEPVVCTDDVKELYDPVPSFEVGEGLQGTVYEAGERQVFEDLTADRTPHRDGETALRSAVLFPLGEHGVLGASSDEPVELDETFLRYGEVLATNASVALTRAKRERELREREQKLEQQNERLDEFASVVSHDLRNPLNVAHGSLELASEGDEEAFDRVGRALDRMEQLTDDLLGLARQGGGVPEAEAVSLSTVAREAWDGVATGDASLVLSTDVRLEADRSQLRQLLENCFRNSLDHGVPDEALTSDPGHSSDGRFGGHSRGDETRPPLTIRVGPLPEGFFVEDDGQGIPETERDEVFAQGYSGADGTGLGLSIVERIARAHGWDVAVTDGELRRDAHPESGGAGPDTGDGGGARFEFHEVHILDD